MKIIIVLRVKNVRAQITDTNKITSFRYPTKSFLLLATVDLSKHVENRKSEHHQRGASTAEKHSVRQPITIMRGGCEAHLVVTEIKHGIVMAHKDITEDPIIPGAAGHG